ncbi:MAG: zinc finger domain-containing protein [Cyanobacterium sp.]
MTNTDKDKSISVFQSGWIEFPFEAYNKSSNLEKFKEPPFIPSIWQELRNIRTGVNKILDDARNQKLIGASLEAKVLVYDTTGTLADTLASLNPDDALNEGNKVDELRYLLLVSQVELVSDESALDESEYRGEITLTDTTLKVAVVNAEGRKCDRCWNYSNSVGTFVDEPLICDRCKEALVGNF